MAEYIEREALWRAFEYEPFYDNADRDEIVLPKIDDFPAADVVEVKNGRWEEWWPGISLIMTGEEMLYRCSVCDAKYADVEGHVFCPNCGARMDGAVDKNVGHTISVNDLYDEDGGEVK